MTTVDPGHPTRLSPAEPGVHVLHVSGPLDRALGLPGAHPGGQLAGYGRYPTPAVALDVLTAS